MFIKSKKIKIIERIGRGLLAFVLSVSLILGPSASYAQTVLTHPNLPVPGTMVPLSPVFNPVMIKGIMINPQEPFKFNFVIDTGDTYMQGEELEAETQKLIKYFLASLTVPEDQMWVNLSPYEKDRIIPNSFSQTAMGRDLLAQDYLLKQLTASLMYPEEELGGTFWQKIYQLAYEKLGTTEIPVNTFNKVWIVPESAKIYEHEKGAYVVESRLKVMLESDYENMRYEMEDGRGKKEDEKQNMEHGTENVERSKSQVLSSKFDGDTAELSSQIIKEIILPEIEREVNEGETFANLRQIYHSMILATWYKQNLKDSILSKVYVDQQKLTGIAIDDKQANQKIYDQYLEAFKLGVFNYIKEDYGPETQEIIPRKYFSGGADFQATDEVIASSPIKNIEDAIALAHPQKAFVDLNPQYQEDSERWTTDGDLQAAAASSPVDLTQEEIQKLTADYRTAERFFQDFPRWEQDHPEAKLLFFVRHGESASNVFRYQQTYESFSPLTIRGVLQSEELLHLLKENRFRFDLLVHSRLERAYETIEPIVENMGVKSKGLRRFREALLPDWEKDLPVFTKNPFAFEAGEYSVQKVQKYLDLFLENFIDGEDQKVLVATHGMTKMIMLMHVLGISGDKYSTVFEMLGNSPHLGITGLYYDQKQQKWNLLIYGDDSYLPQEVRGKTTDTAEIERNRQRFYFMAQNRISDQRSFKDAFITDYMPSDNIINIFSDDMVFSASSPVMTSRKKGNRGRTWKNDREKDPEEDALTVKQRRLKKKEKRKIRKQMGDKKWQGILNSATGHSSSPILSQDIQDLADEFIKVWRAKASFEIEENDIEDMMSYFKGGDISVSEILKIFRRFPDSEYIVNEFGRLLDGIGKEAENEDGRIQLADDVWEYIQEKVFASSPIEFEGQGNSFRINPEALDGKAINEALSEMTLFTPYLIGKKIVIVDINASDKERMLVDEFLSDKKRVESIKAIKEWYRPFLKGKETLGEAINKLWPIFEYYNREETVKKALKKDIAKVYLMAEYGFNEKLSQNIVEKFSAKGREQARLAIQLLIFRNKDIFKLSKFRLSGFHSRYDAIAEKLEAMFASSSVTDKADQETVLTTANRSLSTKKGGIDMNPELLEMNVAGSAPQFDVPFPEGDSPHPETAPSQYLQIEGFDPIIINITPILNLPLLLGLEDEETSEDKPTQLSQNELIGITYRLRKNQI